MIGTDKLWQIYKRHFSGEYRVGRDVFRSILHENGLSLNPRRRRPRTTNSRHGMPTYPNLVKNVIPTRPNQIWVGDITYIEIQDPKESAGYGFTYLSLLQDAYSKMILGWCLAPTLEAKYTEQALQMAAETLPETFSDTLIHHSDRGTQYASANYIDRLTRLRIVPSMTENGNPKDNAMAERINSTIKNELLHGRAFQSIDEARLAIKQAITYYNNERPHLSIDFHTPAEAHQMTGEISKRWHSWREAAIKKTSLST